MYEVEKQFENCNQSNLVSSGSFQIKKIITHTFDKCCCVNTSTNCIHDVVVVNTLSVSLFV